MVPGASDARLFAKLGIQNYGFIPMRLPQDFHLLEMIHATDERIPVDAVHFGVEGMYRVLERFGD